MIVSGENNSQTVVAHLKLTRRLLRKTLAKIAASNETLEGSGTEVAVHLFEESGPDMVKELNGMFGMAIWNVEQRQCVLFRDPLGIKPLYWMYEDGRLVFASEIKSLLKGPSASSSAPTTAKRLWNRRWRAYLPRRFRTLKSLWWMMHPPTRPGRFSGALVTGFV